MSETTAGSLDAGSVTVDTEHKKRKSKSLAATRKMMMDYIKKY